MVWTIKTLQGACLATSLAIEPSTRVAPCTRLLPTTIIDASSRAAHLRAPPALARQG